MGISVNGVSKNYKAVKALQDISFQVKPNELFGLIGPDGAGKTTLFRILTTLLKPSTGTASVAGLDVVNHFKDIRNQVGYMPGKFSLYQDLTIAENLAFFATIFGTTIEENYDLIKDIYVQIEPFKNRPAGKLSGGMKQKLALCCALIHKPKVLFLDEPTTGVDPVSRTEFWVMLKRLQKKNITILVSTPYMDEAAMCDRIALIQDGKILQINTPEALVAQYPKTIFNISANNMYLLIKSLQAYPYQHSVYPFGEFVHYSDTRDTFSIEALKTYLENNQLSHIYIEETQATIEDSFMALAR
ncbi:ABC transporter ATP-binding protein [Bizionia sediminis]|uniref:ABC transporter ATP-binding protein n=1 Tax=Bizionia sediminis TaxID=1737064 RepID=A0ABW5KPA7_9FLAO